MVLITLYIKEYRIKLESKRLEEESERLSKNNVDTPYKNFTSGLIY